MGTLLSADRDLIPAEVPQLIKKYQALAVDWESGAIAWVAMRNNVPCLSLRAVSDLVDTAAGEAYGNSTFFQHQCQEIMANFIYHLPAWLSAFSTTSH